MAVQYKCKSCSAEISKYLKTCPYCDSELSNPERITTSDHISNSKIHRPNSVDPIKQVITITKRLEKHLEETFHATGKGLHEKVSSIRRNLSEITVRKIRKLATIRNKSVHDFVLSNQEYSTFIETAESVFRELSLHFPDISQDNSEPDLNAQAYPKQQTVFPITHQSKSNGIKCMYCGSLNSMDNRFCTSCRQNIGDIRICSHCWKEVGQNINCPFCGTPLTYLVYPEPSLGNLYGLISKGIYRNNAITMTKDQYATWKRNANNKGCLVFLGVILNTLVVLFMSLISF